MLSESSEVTVHRRVRAELASHGAIGDALLLEVTTALATLRRLLSHAALFDEGVLASVRASMRDAERRLARDELRVVVVGEKQCGKSTLLDAIIGDRLLGEARRELQTVTFLHQATVPGFRAQSRSGEVTDFSRKFPDRSHEFERALRAAEKAAREAEQAHALCKADAREAQEALLRKESELNRAFSGLESARQIAVEASGELPELERRAEKLDKSIAELEREVPKAASEKPPRYAFWLWIWRALFLLLKKNVWLRYQALLQDREQARARLVWARGEATGTAEAYTLAESRLDPLGESIESRRAEATATQQLLAAAEEAKDYAARELERLRKESSEHETARISQFFSDLKALSKPMSEASSVVEVAIDYPARLLPDDVVIIDLPGMVSDTAPEWQVIREQADGCILVSELDRAVSGAAKHFLQQLKEVVPHVLLVLTKMDKALANAVSRGGRAPSEQLEQARRIATRRFAREIGRAPESVLSVSVAAEAALNDADSEMSRHFQSETAKLFQLLRHERAMILGAHAAGAIRRCISSIGQAQDHAEGIYRERIAGLEALRTPDPDTFREAELSRAEPAIVSATEEAVRRGVLFLSDSLLLVRREAEQNIAECKNDRELLAVAVRLERELPAHLENQRKLAHLELETGVDHAVRSIELKLFDALRKSYQLLHEVRRAQDSAPRLVEPSEDTASLVSLTPPIEAALNHARRIRLAVGASGAVVGAGIGTFVAPGLGTAIGAALGALCSLVRPKSADREQIRSLLERALLEREQALIAEIQSKHPILEVAIRDAIDRSLERTIKRFGRWISEPLEAEQQMINREREKLASIEQLRTLLQEHDAELERLLAAAADESVGLCR